MFEVDIDQEQKKIRTELVSLQQQLQAVQKQENAIVEVILKKQGVLAFLEELSKRPDGAKEHAGS